MCSSISGRWIFPQPRFSCVSSRSFLYSVAMRRNHHLAMSTLGGRYGRLCERLERLERDRQQRLRVVVDVDRLHVGSALLPVEAFDVVLARLVDVDGVVVDQHGCGEQVHLADDDRTRDGPTYR